MNMSLQQALTVLSRGKVLSMRDAAGSTIVAASGLLWITQEGDGRDEFIGRGESYAIDGAGLVVVEAVADSMLLVLHARQSRRGGCTAT